MKNTVGIDFGTTKTLVAAVDQDGEAQLVRLGRSGEELPTTIHVDAERQFLFGEDADDQLALDQGGYLRRVKRDLGMTDRVHVLNGHEFKPVELVTEFLKNLKKRVEEEYFHGPVDHAVVTVPAKYGPAAREDLKTAARAAGFLSVDLLDEPIAAGIAFLDKKHDTELGNEILVFDWGGGTLDIALVEFRDGEWNLNYDLLEGDRQLGGEDIDDQLIQAVNAFLVDQGLDPIARSNTTDFPLLYRRVVEMKCLLSKKEKHSFAHRTSNCHFDFSCSRTEFEAFISDDLDKAFQCLATWESRANSAGKIIAKVLLVGGSSKIPAVERRVAATEKRPLKWDRGLQAVAIGAAIHAHKGEARKTAEHEARETAEREARETAEREARETAEREARETAEREARETAEREARETAEREARETAEREARETAEREARETAERETRESQKREKTKQLKGIDVFIFILSFCVAIALCVYAISVLNHYLAMFVCVGLMRGWWHLANSPTPPSKWLK